MKYLMAICILLLTHLVYSQKDTITINQIAYDFSKAVTQQVIWDYSTNDNIMEKDNNVPKKSFYRWQWGGYAIRNQ